MDRKLFDIRVSGCAPFKYPTDLYYGLFWYSKDEALEIPKRYPYRCEWGECLSDCILLKNTYPMPWKLSILWLSIIEKKYYFKEEELPQRALEMIWMEHSKIFTHIILGMAPYGNIALWFYGTKKSRLLCSMYANEIDSESKVKIEDD